MPRATWQLRVDWDGDGTFGTSDEDLSDKILGPLTTQIGRNFPSQLSGKAVVGRLSAVLYDPNGTYVTTNPSSTLFGNIVPKRKVELRTTSPSNAVVWTGQLSNINPRKNGPGARQEAVLEAVGVLHEIASQDVRVAIQEDVRTDEAVAVVLDAVDFPTADRLLSTGKTTMTRWWVDDNDALNALRQVEATESGFLHETKAGEIAFRDRHYRLSGTIQTAVGTWEDSATASVRFNRVDLRNPLRHIYNDFNASVQITEPAASSGTLWVNDLATATGTTAPSIPASSTLEVWARYPNASSTLEAFAVDNWITPAAGTDYIVTSDQAGTGDTLSGSVAVAVTKFANSMKMTFTNNSTGTGFFTKMEARGTGLNQKDAVRVSASDATSQGTFGTLTFPRGDSARFVPTVEEGLDWCKYNLAVYKQPIPILSVQFNPVESTAVMNEVLARDLNDKVRIIGTAESGFNIDGEFYIEAIRHQVAQGGFQHRVLFDVSPAGEFTPFWVLGFGTLGTTTRLAY